MRKCATTVLRSLADRDGRADRVALFGSPGTPFVDVQHADDASDMTLAVTRQWPRVPPSLSEHAVMLKR